MPKYNIKRHINKLHDLVCEYEERNDSLERLFLILVHKEALRLAKRAKPVHKKRLHNWSNVFDTSKSIVIFLTSPVWIIPVLFYLKLKDWK